MHKSTVRVYMVSFFLPSLFVSLWFIYVVDLISFPFISQINIDITAKEVEQHCMVRCHLRRHLSVPFFTHCRTHTGNKSQTDHFNVYASQQKEIINTHWIHCSYCMSFFLTVLPLTLYHLSIFISNQGQRLFGH